MKAFASLQTALVAAVLALSPVHALAQWVRSDAPPLGYGGGLACSADGTALMAASHIGSLYTSTNWGSTWATNTAFPWGVYPRYMTSSADGMSLAVLEWTPGDFSPFRGRIYTSRDAGLSWTTQFLPLPPSGWEYWWNYLACSADGQCLAAVAFEDTGFGYPPALLISHDFGLTWPITNTAALWTSVAVSGDASRMFAASRTGLFTSTDAGWTWSTMSALSNSWESLACSADSSVIVAGGADGWIWSSTNHGETWTSNNLASTIYDVKASASGTTLLACYNGTVSLSTNAGLSWAAGPPAGSVYSAISADGSKLALAGNTGIYTLQMTPKPAISIARSSTNVLLSWTVPSMRFVLQQSASLTEPTWVDVGVEPVVNYANLKNEVNVQPSEGQMFYRLISR